MPMLLIPAKIPVPMMMEMETCSVFLNETFHPLVREKLPRKSNAYPGVLTRIKRLLMLHLLLFLKEETTMIAGNFVAHCVSMNLLAIAMLGPSTKEMAHAIPMQRKNAIN